MWDGSGVEQGRKAPYRTHTANTSFRPTLPEPWGKIPGKWDSQGHGAFGAMSQNPRGKGLVRTWAEGGSDEIGEFSD